MKLIHLIFTVLALLISSAAFAQAGNAAAGKDLYILNCGACHGVPPDGNARRAANSATRITSAINNVNSMQSLRGVFTQGELADIAAYIGNPNVVVTTNNTLTVTKAGTGSSAGTVTSTPTGISCGTTCSASFAAGTAVTLNAVVSSGASFGGWSGGCTGTAPSCTVTMSAAQTVNATFNTTTVNAALTVTQIGTGTGSVASSPVGIDCGRTCTANFTANSTVILNASVASGSTFGGWSGGCTGSALSCTVTMDANKTATARFDLAAVPSASLTVSNVGSGSGVVTSSPSGITCGTSCTASFTGGSTVTLTAAANAGSAFNGWSGACAGSTPNCTVFMDSAKTVAANFAVVVVTPPGSANFTGLWWNAAESGWGVNFNHQGDLLFGTLFTYASDGKGLWLVMSGGAKQADGSFLGELYQTTGSAFTAVPFTGANVKQVGKLRVTFTSAGTATMTYDVNGITVTKAITPQPFGPLSVCTGEAITTNRATSVNYQDLWWNPAESGWGVNITHQGNILFATLFIYDAAGRDMWLVLSNGARQPNGSFTGDLYRTIGPAFNVTPFVGVTAPKVGTMTFAFQSGAAGTLVYTVDGVTISKSIQRQVFGTLVPVCR